MKPKRMLLLFAVLILAMPFAGQDVQGLEDAEKADRKKDKIKQGWNFGGLPVVSFDSDLGFQYGALANLYHYGDGSRYPLYDHSFYLEASWFTKGSGIFRFYYDSDRLIRGIRTSVDISFMPDQAFYLYGYNGYEAVYNKPWITEGAEDYKTRLFYRYHREFFRFKADFQGDIVRKKLYWLAGLDFYNIYSADIDQQKFDIPDSVSTLFDQYKEWYIIPESEKSGGRFTVLKLGLVFDTRDNEPNPWRGIWTEIILASAPKPLSSMERGFMKLAITHRQYFTLIKERLTFAYRLAFQTTIAGYTPTYAQTIMYYSRMTGAYNEGLGGIKTLRGISRNRIVGDGWVMGNFELRYRFLYFQWIKQNWYLAIAGFFDTGRVISLIDVEDVVTAGNGLENYYPQGESEVDYFDFGAERFHNSVGGGLYIAMNQNFIIAINFGKALNEQDGNTGFYVGLNYLF
jgi:hypothetical protein